MAGKKTERVKQEYGRRGDAAVVQVSAPEWKRWLALFGTAGLWVLPFFII